MEIQKLPKALGAVFLIAGTFTMAGTAAGQDFEDIKTSKSPLVLKSQGSFYVGGKTIFSDALITPPSGHITTGQMYVRYMIPQSGNGVPVVMVHGGTLSGKSWETTPDGRMGWDEYFVRKGHPVYVPDQVNRARSGTDVTPFNKVKLGLVPPATQPGAVVLSNELAWQGFRFGPTFGVPYPDSQFPTEAAGELSKQAVPDLFISNYTTGATDPTEVAMSQLAVKLKGAVLMGHSQSGDFPLRAILINQKAVKGAILLDTALCPTPAISTDAQIQILATVPILAVFGDRASQKVRCQAFLDRINAAGGNAKMLDPTTLGIFGNSHMIMMDKNNLKIADMILNWIDKNVKYKGRDHDDDDDDQGHHH